MLQYVATTGEAINLGDYEDFKRRDPAGSFCYLPKVLFVAALDQRQ